LFPPTCGIFLCVLVFFYRLRSVFFTMHCKNTRGWGELYFYKFFFYNGLELYGD
jgi:hypothetical protein